MMEDDGKAMERMWKGYGKAETLKKYRFLLYT